MTKGLVTLTDVIEAIAGDLPEHGEDIEQEIVLRDDGSWLVDGILPTDELETATGIVTSKKLRTVAGFVLERLGHIPKVGDSFCYGRFRFDVVDMDGNRVDKVLIQIDRNYPELHNTNN